jgi:hypothetical protein
MSRSTAFCDGFTVTVPKDSRQDTFQSIRGVIDSLGCTLVDDGCYRSPEGAMLLYGNRGPVSWFQAKGKFVAALRSRQLLNEFLASFSLGPHRVSSCDLTVDEFVASPSDRVSDVYALAHAGHIGFSRKALQHRQIKKLMSPVLYDDSGKDTGTVYLGLRSAEVRGRVYDKTQERAKDGECIGLTVRHEMTITSKMGVTLRDVADPESCFYHFWPDVLLSRPEGVPPWSPSEGGYSVPRVDRLPSQRLKQRVSSSSDLGELILLAQSCGPEGLVMLHRLIDERVLSEGRCLGSA